MSCANCEWSGAVVRGMWLKVAAACGSAAMFVAGPVLGSAREGADFNGDGYCDLAIGVPFEDFSGVDDGGVVHVLYGRSSGLSASGDQLWSQNVSGISGTAQDGDQFGWDVTWGDFDNDGFDDLAIGIPGEQVSGEDEAGAVCILYGSAQGLTAAGDGYFHQNVEDMNQSAQADDRFGQVVEAGDFDGDGFDDLAIGVPREDYFAGADVGAVQIIFGSAHGLTSKSDEVLTQNSPDVEDIVEEGDQFGFALAAGDFDNDGREDLAIGAPFENDEGEGTDDSGVVHVLYGTAAFGPDGAGSQVIDQVIFTGGVVSTGDNFGWSLAAGDFNGNGKDDLAIGVPGESDIESLAGEVDVIYGSSNGLNFANTQRWARTGGGDVLDLPGTAEGDDACGYALQAGNFDGNSRDDLAIGIPFRDVGGEAVAGQIVVVYGGANGLKLSGQQSFDQDATGVSGSAENSDFFGLGMSRGDFDGDGRSDLVVGVMGQSVGGDSFAGAVHVFYGASGGLSTNGDRVFTQDTDGIADGASEGDRVGMFGSFVAVKL